MGFIHKMRQRDEKKKAACGIRFEMACISDTGMIREHNEDNFCFYGSYMPREHQSSEKVKIYEGTAKSHPAVAVFDGMGGEHLGELASYTAAAGFFQYVKERDQTLDYSRKELGEQLKCLNDRVVEAGKKAGVNCMGTTVSVLALDEERFWIANLGDSPVYLVRNHGIRLISKKHTNEELLKKRGIKNQKRGLTQFLGIAKEEFAVEPYVYEETLEKGDLFLVCSDGLTDMVSQREIMCTLLRNVPLQDSVSQLKDMAVQNGGRDNITIILCRILECV